MSKRDDDFIDFDLPFFRMQMRGGGRTISFGGGDFEEDNGVIDMDQAASEEYWTVRRSVRRRLRFLRHLVVYLGLNGLFFLIDWGTGGEGNGINWAQWVALVWGFFLAWEFVARFVGPNLWGREAEQRLIERELRKRRST
jgi:hypothetical protein